jgi:hypothetical protein
MAEVLVEFENRWVGPDGKTYEARACGRGRSDGLWEGWLEFIPTDGSEAIATGRETTQPNREDTLYWAGGLTLTYIDGALARVLKPAPQVATRPRVTARPAFNAPAQRPSHGRPSDSLGGHAVLDPFAVFRESDTVLRGQLNALDAGQLRNIVREYQISDLPNDQLMLLSRDELIAMIITAAEKRAA